MNSFQFAPQTFVKRLALFALAWLTLAPLAAKAQHEREESTKVNYFEYDNAEAMQEWLQKFLNPGQDPLFWEKRMQGMEQFANMTNYAALKANPSAAWKPAGYGQNDTVGGYGEVSGRTLDFAEAVDGTFYVSPASGGLWKSTDRGQNWVPISDGKINPMAVQAIATDPKNANVVYAGTGEEGAGLSVVHSGGASINGTGIYKSTDAGLTWTLLASSKQIGTFITKIVVSSSNSNNVFASGSVLWRSTDAGATWAKMKLGGSDLSLAYGIETFVMDPTNSMVLYAHTGSSFVHTTDGGDTWSILSSGKTLPHATGGLTSVAISSANPKVLYTSVSVSSGRFWGCVGAVGYSTDAGQTWQTSLDTASCPDNFVTQGYYCQGLAADPKIEGNVIYGGLDMYASSSYGGSPSLIANSNAGSNSTFFSHADIHRLKYYGDTLFAMTDGGLHYYHNGAWHQELNSTINSLQELGGDAFIDKSSRQPKFFIAGAQDNGTTKWSFGSTSGPMIHGGDGGRCFIEQSQGLSIYATYPEFRPGYGSLYRSNDGGATWTGDLLGSAGIKTGGPNNTTDLVNNAYEQYDVCESKFSEAVFCGNNYGWITHNSFNTLTKMATTAGGKAIGSPTFIHISKANLNTIYYGGGSKCYWSTDAGQTWTAPQTVQGSTTASFNGSPIWITTNPYDETHVFLVTSSQNGNSVYMSTDGGATWTQPSQNTGNTLPTWVYRTIAADKNDRIFVGGDGGVLAYDPNDQTWTALANGIPQGTIVSGLQVRGTSGSSSGWLNATTYGRGMYYIKVDDIFKTGGGVASNDAPAAPAMITSVYPNPVPSQSASTIKYTLESGSIMQIAVFDNLGRQEKLLANEWSSQGEHEKSLDLSGLAPGTHYILLTADGVSISRPVTVE